MTAHPDESCDTLAPLVPATSGQSLRGLLTAMAWDDDGPNGRRVAIMAGLLTEGDGGRCSVSPARQAGPLVGRGGEAVLGELGRTGNCQVAVTSHYPERTLACGRGHTGVRSPWCRRTRSWCDGSSGCGGRGRVRAGFFPLARIAGGCRFRRPAGSSATECG